MVLPNMTSENLKVPLHEDGSGFERYQRKKRSRKLQIIAGVCILVILNVSLFVFTLFYTLSRVRRLEYKVELLKNTLSDIMVLDSTIANAIEQMEDVPDCHTVDDVLQKPDDLEESQLYVEDSDEFSDYFEYNYDLDLNDTEEANKYEDNINIINAANLTKQGTESSKKKRDIVAATQDGVLINSESYAEKRARNMTRHRQRPTTRYVITPPSVRMTYFKPSPKPQGSTVYTPNSRIPLNISQLKRTSASPVFVRKSRVKHTEDKSKAFRQVVKKSSMKSADPYPTGDSTPETDFTIVRDDFGRRRYRPLEILDERHPRAGRVRLPSVHFSGDTSRYVVGQHTNFNGNGHLRHLQRTFVDWKISDWVKSAGMDTLFTMNEGVLTVKESGIYFIYAQIYYLDEHDISGFRVHKNSESILQCTVTSTERRLKGNTCYTAGTEYLSEGDTISLADISSGRYSLFEPGKSFFGLVKFSDIKIK